MSNLILPPSCRNVQLTEKERTCVYISTVTGRILGFGHESMQPLYREGYRREVLYHAHDIDRYAALYRKQEAEDLQEEDYKRLEREEPARNAIMAALRARRDHVSPQDRAYIDANLMLMERRRERMKTRKQQSFMLCERYDSDTRQEDIALDSPIFKAKE